VSSSAPSTSLQHNPLLFVCSLESCYQSKATWISLSTAELTLPEAMQSITFSVFAEQCAQPTVAWAFFADLDVHTFITSQVLQLSLQSSTFKLTIISLCTLASKGIMIILYAHWPVKV